MEPIDVTERVQVPASALSFHATRSGGPGGQNVNKVSSKVDLRVDLAAVVGLTSEQHRRLMLAARPRLDEDGHFVVTSQLTRSQPQNLEDARDKVRALIAGALIAPKRRVPTKPSRASKRRRLDDKKRNGDKKRERRGASD